LSSIADSDALRDDGRIFPQHQAVVTLLQGWLSDPTIQSFRWLDLACGRGQILTGVRGGLPLAARSKIDYFAYDMRQQYAKDTDHLAAELGFRSHHHDVGYLTDFHKYHPAHRPFDLITLTNTVHEVLPAQLASVLIESIERLSTSGCLFVYDMESVEPPELGAVPWTSGEIARIIESLLASLGVVGYEPAVGQWRHRTCDAWNVQIYRNHLNVSAEALAANRGHAHDRTTATIRQLLSAKLEQCSKALDKLTEYGAETADEQNEKGRLLYEFWALSRATEVLR
jgi:hypothetical protein